MEGDDSDDVIVNFVESMDDDDFNASSRSKSRSAAKTRRRESEVEQTKQAEPKPELSKEEAKIEELKVQEDSQSYEEDEAESKAEAKVEAKPVAEDKAEPEAEAEPELKAKPEAGLNLDAFDPDFDEPNLTKEEEERLSNMNLDGLLEEVANSSQDLFSDEDKELLGDEIEKSRSRIQVRTLIRVELTMKTKRMLIQMELEMWSLISLIILTSLTSLIRLMTRA